MDRPGGQSFRSPNDPRTQMRRTQSATFTSPPARPTRSASRGAINPAAQPITTLRELIVQLGLISTSPTKMVKRSMPLSTDKTSTTIRKLNRIQAAIDRSPDTAFDTPENRTQFLYCCLPFFDDASGTTSEDKRQHLLKFIVDNVYKSGSDNIFSEFTSLKAHVTGRDKLGKYDKAIDALQRRVIEEMQKKGHDIISFSRSTSSVSARQAWASPVASPTIFSSVTGLNVGDNELELATTSYKETLEVLKSLPISEPRKNAINKLPAVTDEMSVAQRRDTLVAIMKLTPQIHDVSIPEEEHNFVKAIIFLSAALYKGDLEALDYAAFNIGMNSPRLCATCINFRTLAMIEFKSSSATGLFPHEQGFSITSLENLVTRMVGLAQLPPPGFTLGDVLHDIIGCRTALILFMNELPEQDDRNQFVPHITALTTAVLELLDEKLSPSSDLHILDFEEAPVKENEDSPVDSMIRLRRPVNSLPGAVFEETPNWSRRDGIVFDLENSAFEDTDVDLIDVDRHVPTPHDRIALPFKGIGDESRRRHVASPDRFQSRVLKASDLFDMKSQLLWFCQSTEGNVSVDNKRLIEKLEAQIGALPDVTTESLPEKPSHFHSLVSAWAELVSVEGSKLDTLRVYLDVLNEMKTGTIPAAAERASSRPVDSDLLASLTQSIQKLIALQETLVAQLNSTWKEIESSGSLAIYNDANEEITKLGKNKNEFVDLRNNASKTIREQDSIKKQGGKPDEAKLAEANAAIASAEVAMAAINVDIDKQKERYEGQTNAQIQILEGIVKIGMHFRSALPAIGRLTADCAELRLQVFTQETAVRFETQLAAIIPDTIKGIAKWERSNLRSLAVELDSQRAGTYPLMFKAGTEKLPPNSDVAIFLLELIADSKTLAGIVNSRLLA